jgi:YesN/AraC family two-component response regulator
MAVNGKDAIVKAKKRTPDLIIMDVMMPKWMEWKLAKIFGKS